MIRIGRALSLAGILGYLSLMSLVIPVIRGAVNANQTALLVVDVLGAVGAVGVLSSWGLALYHWGTRFTGSNLSRRRWGFGLTLGLFVGAWIYWFTRVSSRATAQNSATG
jgi:hypothetical protein